MLEEVIIDAMKDAGVEIVGSLPCNKLIQLIARLPDEFIHVPLSREEDGIGFASGVHLAGKRCAMVIQSTGLGNSFNALASLVKTYRLPLPVVASWRGSPGETIPAQTPFGEALPSLLEGLGISFCIINDQRDIPKIREAMESAYNNKKIYVVLIQPGAWETCSDHKASSSVGPSIFPTRLKPVNCLLQKTIRPPCLNRYQAIEVIASLLREELLVVNIGFPCREMYNIEDRPENFYMLGSLGLCSSVACGMARARPGRRVVSLDGDGSLLMNPNCLNTAAQENLGNLTIIALDNGTFGSTGDQRTGAYLRIDLEFLAIAMGFSKTLFCRTSEELRDAFRRSASEKGPWFIHCIVKPGNANLPEVPLDPVAIRDRFQKACLR